MASVPVGIDDRFVDYFAIVGPPADGRIDLLPGIEQREIEPLKLRYKADILSRFPEKDAKDKALPEHIWLFCFPNGLQLSASEVAPSIVTFVLTELDGAKFYGTSLTFWEPYVPSFAMDGKKSSSDPKELKDRKENVDSKRPKKDENLSRSRAVSAPIHSQSTDDVEKKLAMILGEIDDNERELDRDLGVESAIESAKEALNSTHRSLKKRKSSSAVKNVKSSKGRSVPEEGEDKPPKEEEEEEDLDKMLEILDGMMEKNVIPKSPSIQLISHPDGPPSERQSVSSPVSASPARELPEDGEPSSSLSGLAASDEQKDKVAATVGKEKEEDSISTVSSSTATGPGAAEEESKSYWAPKSALIISSHPFFQIFREWLRLFNILRQATNPAPLAICETMSGIVQRFFRSGDIDYSPISTEIARSSLPSCEEEFAYSCLNIPIEYYVAHLLTSVPIPKPGSLAVKFRFPTESLCTPKMIGNGTPICSDSEWKKRSIKEEKSFVMHYPTAEEFPLLDFPLRVLFDCLSIGNVIKVFALLLTESKIVLHSSSLTLLTYVAEAFSALLYPFEYPHIFIPVLPLSLLDFLNAPMPYIVGIHTDHEDRIPSVLEVVHVYLDKDVVDVKISYEDLRESGGNAFPEELSEFLTTNLKRTVYSHLFKLDGYVPINTAPAASSSPSSNAAVSISTMAPDFAQMNDSVRSVFCDLFVRLFGDYRKYVFFVRLFPRPIPIFKKKSFLKDKENVFGEPSSRKLLDFLSKFLESQFFVCFLESHGCSFFKTKFANEYEAFRNANALKALGELTSAIPEDDSPSTACTSSTTTSTTPTTTTTATTNSTVPALLEGEFGSSSPSSSSSSPQPTSPTSPSPSSATSQKKSKRALRLSVMLDTGNARAKTDTELEAENVKREAKKKADEALRSEREIARKLLREPVPVFDAPRVLGAAHPRPSPDTKDFVYAPVFPTLSSQFLSAPEIPLHELNLKKKPYRARMRLDPEAITEMLGGGEQEEASPSATTPSTPLTPATADGAWPDPNRERLIQIAQNRSRFFDRAMSTIVQGEGLGMDASRFLKALKAEHGSRIFAQVLLTFHDKLDPNGHLSQSAYDILKDLMMQALNEAFDARDYLAIKLLMDNSMALYRDVNGVKDFMSSRLKEHAAYMDMLFWENAIYDAIGRERRKEYGAEYMKIVFEWDDFDEEKKNSFISKEESSIFSQIGKYVYSMLNVGCSARDIRRFMHRMCTAAGLSDEHTQTLEAVLTNMVRANDLAEADSIAEDAEGEGMADSDAMIAKRSNEELLSRSQTMDQWRSLLNSGESQQRGVLGGGAGGTGGGVGAKAPRTHVHQLLSRAAQKRLSRAALPLEMGEGGEAELGSIERAEKYSTITFHGHTEGVLCMSVSEMYPMASGSFDGTVRVWDKRSGQSLHVLQGHTAPVQSVVMHNQKVISGSFDHSVKLWDLVRGRKMRTLRGHRGPVSCLTAEGNRILSGSLDYTLKLWDARNGKKAVMTLVGHTGAISCCQMSLSHSLVFSGSRDCSLKCWDLRGGKSIHTFQGHNDWIRCMDQVGGKTLMSGSHDHELRIWDVSTGRCTKALQGHTGIVNSCKFYDSKFAVSGSEDATVKIWDFTYGRCTHTLKGHADEVLTLAVHNPGSGSRNTKIPPFIASGGIDSAVKLWNVDDYSLHASCTGHSKPVSCIEVDDEGNVYSGSSDNTIKCFRLSSN